MGWNTNNARSQSRYAVAFGDEQGVPLTLPTRKMRMSRIGELLMDAWRAILGYIFGIDPDWDPTGSRSVSRLPWYVSAIFCFAMIPVLIGVGLLLNFLFGLLFR